MIFVPDNQNITGMFLAESRELFGRFNNSMHRVASSTNSPDFFPSLLAFTAGFLCALLLVLVLLPLVGHCLRGCCCHCVSALVSKWQHRHSVSLLSKDRIGKCGTTEVVIPTSAGDGGGMDTVELLSSKAASNPFEI